MVDLLRKKLLKQSLPRTRGVQEGPSAFMVGLVMAVVAEEEAI